MSRTRSGPNRSSSPSEVLNGPSATAMSSPNMTTRSSRSISSAIARPIAWFIRNLAIMGGAPFALAPSGCRITTEGSGAGELAKACAVDVEQLFQHLSSVLTEQRSPLADRPELPHPHQAGKLSDGTQARVLRFTII